jgi:hypothetical protein
MLTLALALAGAVSATTLVRMNLDELVGDAQSVARVKCLSNESRWEGGQIWTITQFEVSETLKGAPPRLISVRLIGGKVGSITSRVEAVPRFQPGEELYLFLEPNVMGELTVTSWVQGTFRIRKEAGRPETVTQDTGSARIYDPATKAFTAGGVRRMPVSEFRQRVAEAVERGRGRQQ